MIPLQGLLLTAIVAASYADPKGPSDSSNNRKPRELTSIGDANAASYDPNIAILNSYLQGTADLQFYQNFAGSPNFHNNRIGLTPGSETLYNAFQFPFEGVKRYAVKEDVDEGFVTTTRPVYIPRLLPKTPIPSNEGWRPIITNTPRPAFARNVYYQNTQPAQTNIQLPAQPQASVKTTYVPVEKFVGVPVPEPYTVPVYQPYPVAVPQPYPVQVPLPVEVQSTVTVPVEKPVPVPVVKHVPYGIVKNQHVPVALPYPVPVPLYKTKYVVHSKK